MEEISRASGSVGLSYGAHSNLCINQLVSSITQELECYIIYIICFRSQVRVMYSGEEWEPCSEAEIFAKGITL